MSVVAQKCLIAPQGLHLCSGWFPTNITNLVLDPGSDSWFIAVFEEFKLIYEIKCWIPSHFPKRWSVTSEGKDVVAWGTRFSVRVNTCIYLILKLQRVPQLRGASPVRESVDETNPALENILTLILENILLKEVTFGILQWMTRRWSSRRRRVARSMRRRSTPHTNCSGLVI